MLTAARDHCLAPARSVDEATAYGGRYRRLFADLPRLQEDEAAVRALGVEGGWCDCGDDDADDDARVAAAGRSSASTWPTTSPPTAPRSRTTPTRRRSATSARRRPTSSACTAPGRSPTRTCTSATTRRSCCSPAMTCPATTRRWRWWATRARTPTCSSTSSKWRWPACTTAWWTACARTASTRTRCSGRPSGRRAGTTSGWCSNDFLPRVAGADLVAGGAARRAAGLPARAR